MLNHPLPRKRDMAGFTLPEVVLACALVAILATLAAPSLQSVVRQARRSDGRWALAEAQQAQVRWRSLHPRHASAAELGLAGQSPQGHYRLEVSRADNQGFELRASALGTQADDALCRILWVREIAGQTEHGSGADAGTPNQEADNRRCWPR